MLPTVLENKKGNLLRNPPVFGGGGGGVSWEKVSRWASSEMNVPECNVSVAHFEWDGKSRAVSTAAAVTRVVAAVEVTAVEGRKVRRLKGDSLLPFCSE